ncbi:MAG TPA: SHOCT domain-containing protein [Candidatus Saccharimonadales bacterium]|nr:SHOCT domain-containing protein [Candidatus Saccharimonadales bacterium]
MGLLRGMARTAVVAGTATSVANRVSRRQQNRWAAKDAQAAAAQQPADQYGYGAPPSSPADPEVAQLQQLATLHDQGILSSAEFEAKKKQILGI